MGASREEVLVRELLEEHGTKIRHTTHGVLWRLPGGKMVMAYAERSKRDLDPRAWKNQLADVRRALRAAGIGQQEDGMDVDDNGSSNSFDSVIAAQHKLASLGVHVRRKRRYVDEAEAVVDVTAVAVLLGLVDEHDVKGAKVELLDLEGNVVLGPFTVCVVTEGDA